MTYAFLLNPFSMSKLIERSMYKEKAHVGNATQNIHLSLMQDTHTHTTAHIASLTHLLVKTTQRHT